jgi:hypothetical protein
MKDIGFYESFPATARALNTRRPIFGFGVNDAPFFTQFHFNGKLLAHPAYLAWKSMIARCYDQKYKSKFAPSGHPFPLAWIASARNCLLFVSFISTSPHGR